MMRASLNGVMETSSLQHVSKGELLRDFAGGDDAAEVGEKLLVLLFAEKVAGGWHIGLAGRH